MALRARKEITSQSETDVKAPAIEIVEGGGCISSILPPPSTTQSRGFDAVSDAEVISLRALRSIAFVTPWPPNVMGIGETCYALVKRLAEISPWHFSVYTNALNPTQIPGVLVHALPFDAHGFIDVAAALPALRRHDLVVHQM